MKRILFFICFTGLLAACGSNDTTSTTETASISSGDKKDSAASTSNLTSIQWIDSTYQDLGRVKEGAMVEVSYKFKNAGDKSLVIEDVVAGCGCTVPEKPEKAFAPGEEGVIRAKFDSKGRFGTNEKYVTVTSNTQPEKSQTLRFKVEVTN
jgi:hypothetical protein